MIACANEYILIASLTSERSRVVKRPHLLSAAKQFDPKDAAGALNKVIFGFVRPSNRAVVDLFE